MFSKPAKLLQQKILRQIGTIKEEFTITDIKNDHLVYVQDPNGKLPFMK